MVSLTLITNMEHDGVMSLHEQLCKLMPTDVKYEVKDIEPTDSPTGFYRATACNATHGIAVGILSVCPSVCLSVCPTDACIVTKLNNALRIF